MQAGKVAVIINTIQRNMKLVCEKANNCFTEVITRISISTFPSLELSLVPDLRSLWFQGKLLQLTDLMATHQGKTAPRSGGRWEDYRN